MNNRLGDLGSEVPSWAVEPDINTDAATSHATTSHATTSHDDVDVELGRPVSARVTDATASSTAFTQPKFM